MKWGKRFPYFSLMIVSLILLVFVPSSNEAIESKKGVWILSLKECIELALKRNLDIISERINPRIQEVEIVKEKAVFDPSLAFETKKNKSVSEPTSILSGAGVEWWIGRFLGWRETLEQESLDFNVGLTEKIPTGGQYELKFINTKFKTSSIYEYYDESYSSSLYISFVQPLLKNFGLNVNRARIRIASNNRDISMGQLKIKVTAVISELQETYWGLVAAIEELEVRRQSLELAQNLLAQNRILVKEGRLPSVATLQAENAVASRKEGVLLAQNAVKDAQDRLKKIVNLMDEPTQEERPILPSDRPHFIEKNTNVADSYELALANRAELNQARIALANQELAFKLAKNQILPKLDILASYRLTGTDPHYRDNINEVFDRDMYSWEAGVVLEIPLGNRLAKSEYSQEKMKLRQAKIKLDSTKKDILLEVRKVVREIETNRERIELTRTARVLAEEKLKAEEERFKLGRSTTTDLLKFQEELSLAKSSENRALVDCRKSLSRWEAATGQTIEENNIEIASTED